jgi:hypothetical protein
MGTEEGTNVVGTMSAQIGSELGNKAEYDAEILGDVATIYSKVSKQRI